MPVFEEGESAYPLNALGHGIFLGIMTGIFRMFGNAAEGVSYAIILGNLLVPLIEKWTLPRAFGIPKPVKKKAVKESSGS